MDAISPDHTVGDIVTRHPGALPVFERLGIDYCCGGGSRLDEAASARGLGWQEVAAQIGAALAAAADSPAQPSWADAPLTDLMGHIIGRYHAKLRELHEHIHLENNILFPRAAALEARVMGR